MTTKKPHEIVRDEMAEHLSEFWSGKIKPSWTNRISKEVFDSATAYWLERIGPLVEALEHCRAIEVETDINADEPDYYETLQIVRVLAGQALTNWRKEGV